MTPTKLTTAMREGILLRVATGNDYALKALWEERDALQREVEEAWGSYTGACAIGDAAKERAVREHARALAAEARERHALERAAQEAEQTSCAAISPDWAAAQKAIAKAIQALYLSAPPAAAEPGKDLAEPGHGPDEYCRYCVDVVALRTENTTLRAQLAEAQRERDEAVEGELSRAQERDEAEARLARVSGAATEALVPIAALLLQDDYWQKMHLASQVRTGLRKAHDMLLAALSSPTGEVGATVTGSFEGLRTDATGQLGTTDAVRVRVTANCDDTVVPATFPKPTPPQSEDLTFNEALRRLHTAEAERDSLQRRLDVCVKALFRVREEYFHDDEHRALLDDALHTARGEDGGGE